MPNIYATPPDVPRVPVAGRFLALGLAVGCLALLITAARMPPSRRGFGTHSDQLGLPACNFLQVTGVPCPSCGMTTSFSWFVRGNWIASFYVQPMGMILALLAAASVWGGLYVAISGRPAHRLLRLVPARYTLFPLLLAGILAWGWKILIHLNGIDGWGT